MARLVNLRLDEIAVGEGIRKIIDEDSIRSFQPPSLGMGFSSQLWCSPKMEATSCL